MVPTGSSTQSDPLTTWMYKLLNYLFCLCHRVLGPAMHVKEIKIDTESGLAVSNNDSAIRKASRLVTATISSVVPVMTIYVLNVLNTTEKRIGFTAAMTALIAGYLTFFTNASRVEVLSATAA